MKAIMDHMCKSSRKQQKLDKNEEYDLIIERYMHFADDFGLFSYYHELHSQERKMNAKKKLLSKSLNPSCKLTVVIKPLTMSTYYLLYSQLILQDNEKMPTEVDYLLIKNRDIGSTSRIISTYLPQGKISKFLYKRILEILS